MSYNNNRRFNRRPNMGRRTIKTFDPTKLIHNMNLIASSTDDKVEETQIKNSFNDFYLKPEVKSAIKFRNFDVPTAIQDQSIPAILEGKDVVGIANTGTGKTGAFLIPLINKVLSNNQSKVLIVAPTRELAVQIEEEFKQFSKKLRLYSCVCIGGANIRKQINQLSRNPEFVLGTPGRLIDLSNQNKLDFSQFNSVVLDEVDRMLDMGFINDIKKIIALLPHDRQSLFFSATLDNRTTSIMSDFAKNPKIISIQSNQTNMDIVQEAITLNGRDKNMLLQEILDNREVVKTLIFVRTRHGVDRLSRMLNKQGFKTSVMHGNKSQNQRQRSLNQFREGVIDTLIATDVASRGIDVENITHVINYDLPETQEDYIHRIGRTGRSGNKGVAISFIG